MIPTTEPSAELVAGLPADRKTRIALEWDDERGLVYAGTAVSLARPDRGRPLPIGCAMDDGHRESAFRALEALHPLLSRTVAKVYTSRTRYDPRPGLSFAKMRVHSCKVCGSCFIGHTTVRYCGSEECDRRRKAEATTNQNAKRRERTAWSISNCRCSECGGKMPDRQRVHYMAHSAGGGYCSSACRQKSYRERKAEALRKAAKAATVEKSNESEIADCRNDAIQNGMNSEKPAAVTNLLDIGWDPE